MRAFVAVCIFYVTAAAVTFYFGVMFLDMLFVFNSLLLGVGLAMDAFSVSLANGLSEPKMRRFKATAIAGAFAFFQALMPMIGWVCVKTVVSYFTGLQKAVPWIALVLLLYIGGSLLIEGIKGSDEHKTQRLTPKVLLIQSIATSIDALSVGFTIADYSLGSALVCAVIIAVVTFIICTAGLEIGKRVGMKLSGKASILGGVILIGIGLEIFITGIF